MFCCWLEFIYLRFSIVCCHTVFDSFVCLFFFLCVGLVWQLSYVVLASIVIFFCLFFSLPLSWIVQY